MAIPSKNRKIQEKDDLQVAEAMQQYKREYKRDHWENMQNIPNGQ